MPIVGLLCNCGMMYTTIKRMEKHFKEDHDSREFIGKWVIKAGHITRIVDDEANWKRDVIMPVSPGTMPTEE